MSPNSPKLAERNSTAILAQKAVADRMGTKWHNVKLTDRELAMCAVWDGQLSLLHHDRDRMHQRLEALERAQPYRAKTIVDPERRGGFDAA